VKTSTKCESKNSQNQCEEKIDKPKHFGECANSLTKQHEDKNSQTQTICKVHKPMKPNNMKPKLMNLYKNAQTTNLNNTKPNTNECKQFGFYRMHEPT
jgi:hypothetical protein